MAPWQSIEVGFVIAVHTMFALLGAFGAVVLVGLATAALFWVMEKLKP